MNAPQSTDVSTLSLIVAILAVIVSPAVSWCIARQQVRSSLEKSRQQVRSSLEIANKGIVKPMRQAWIDKLRELLAEFASSTRHYWAAGFEDRTDEEYRHLTLLETRIQLMLNPNESDHCDLESLVHRMVRELDHGPGGRGKYPDLHPEMIALSRKILKREWDRVRKPIRPAALN